MSFVKILKATFNLLTFLSVILVVFTIHEYGHLQEMQRKEIAIEEFSLGIGPLVYEYRGKEFRISLRAFPVMAYVQPSALGIERFKILSQSERTVINFAGIRNNLIAGAIAVITLQILGYMRGNLSRIQLTIEILSTPIKIILLYVEFIYRCLLLGCPQQSKYLLLSIGKICPQKQVQRFIVYNLGIGLLNFLPIVPLDGGHIAQDIIVPLVAHYPLVVMLAPYSMLVLFFFFSVALMIPLQFLKNETTAA